jgi:hypothetical protein
MNQVQMMEYVDAHANAKAAVQQFPGSDTWPQIERETRAALEAAIGKLFAELEAVRAARTE